MEYENIAGCTSRMLGAQCNQLKMQA